MCNIIRYIILRWKLIKAVHAKGRVYTDLSSRRRLDKQVKDIAWLVVKHKFGDPELTLRVKHSLTKKKKLFRYVEIKGSMVLSDAYTVTLTVSNALGIGYRMVANVARNGKPLFVTHGHASNCFDVMKAMETKRGS